MKVTYLFISSVFVAWLINAGCGQQNNQAPSVKKAGTSTSLSIDSVPVFALKKDSVNKLISFPAELIPFERAEIFPKVSGYINALKVDIGDHVRKGQVLATLEAPEMVANYAQANADVQSARSKYLGSLDAYRRIVNAARVEGTIAAGELEKVKSQMLADSASLQAIRSRMNAYARLKDYLVIRAPFNGVITQRNVDPGTLVGTGNAKPMLVLEDIGTLRLRVPVPEAYTSAAPETGFINFTVDAQPGITYKAGLSRKAGALNLTNRTETWEYIFKNTSEQLKSGMYANAKLKLGRKDPSFLVPASAVATNLEKRFVIRLKEGKTEWVDVRTGINMDDKIEIFGDLNTGDLLLVRATDEVKPGTALVPKLPAR